jgi:hypothetical protein
VTRLTRVDEATKYPHWLRRVEIYDPEQELTLAFLTNHLTFDQTRPESREITVPSDPS